MNWPLVALGDITSKIGSGATPRGGQKAYKTEGTPLIRSMNVHDGRFANQGLAFIDEKQADALQNVTLREGDVLLNITGASVARSCRLPAKYAGGRVNQHVAIIRPLREQVLPEYLEHLLVSPTTKDVLLRIAGGGATREAITKTAIEELKIPLPPLEEQKRIAGILDQADALRRLRTRALDKLNTLGQAIFHEMFGKHAVSNRKLDQLGDHASRITKGESPKWQGHDYQEEGSLFVTSENVGWGNLLLKRKKFIPFEFHNKLERSQLKNGDLLINLVGASIGRACLFSGWNGEANINQAVAVVSLDGTSKSLRNYALSYVLSDVGQKYLLGSRVDGARANVSLKNIRELPFFLPTEADLSIFSSKIEHLERQKRDLQQALFKADSLFVSLQHGAFRGEL